MCETGQYSTYNLKWLLSLGTHPKQIKPFERLTRDDGDELHLTKKANFWRCEARWPSESHLKAQKCFVRLRCQSRFKLRSGSTRLRCTSATTQPSDFLTLALMRNLDVCSATMITASSATLLALVPLLYTAWAYQVNTTVPKPYLDEYFHIRQAQAYCAGDYGQWDPKITTPPGLYLLSFGAHALAKLVWRSSDCGVAELRTLNLVVALLVLPFQLFHLRKSIRGRSGLTTGQDEIHNVANILLFPLILFFSGLYYTDVCSLSFALAVHQIHYESLSDRPSRLLGPAFLLTGLWALLMRQTNIFWVAIYPAGLAAVHYLKEFSASRGEHVYDPPISEAWMEG